MVAGGVNSTLLQGGVAQDADSLGADGLSSGLSAGLGPLQANANLGLFQIPISASFLNPSATQTFDPTVTQTPTQTGFFNNNLDYNYIGGPSNSASLFGGGGGGSGGGGTPGNVNQTNNNTLVSNLPPPMQSMAPPNMNLGSSPMSMISPTPLPMVNTNSPFANMMPTTQPIAAGGVSPMMAGMMSMPQMQQVSGGQQITPGTASQAGGYDMPQLPMGNGANAMGIPNFPQSFGQPRMAQSAPQGSVATPGGAVPNNQITANAGNGLVPPPPPNTMPQPAMDAMNQFGAAFQPTVQQAPDSPESWEAAAKASLDKLSPEAQQKLEADYAKANEKTKAKKEKHPDQIRANTYRLGAEAIADKIANIAMPPKHVDGEGNPLSEAMQATKNEFMAIHPNGVNRDGTTIPIGDIRWDMVQNPSKYRAILQKNRMDAVQAATRKEPLIRLRGMRGGSFDRYMQRYSDPRAGVHDYYNKAEERLNQQIVDDTKFVQERLAANETIDRKQPVTDIAPLKTAFDTTNALAKEYQAKADKAFEPEFKQNAKTFAENSSNYRENVQKAGVQTRLASNAVNQNKTAGTQKGDRVLKSLKAKEDTQKIENNSIINTGRDIHQDAELAAAIKNAHDLGLPTAPLKIQWAQKHGQLPKQYSDIQLTNAYQILQSGKGTDEQLAARGIDPKALRDAFR